MTADMGYLYPIMCDEVVPGDKFEIGNEIVIRFQPLVAPVLHEINAYVHYYFVPYRLLDDTWEDFITGGPEGDSVAVLPRWDPTSYGVGSLWDYLGFPAAVKPTGRLPLDFPRRAYNLIYNEYYRDDLIDEVALTNEHSQEELGRRIISRRPSHGNSVVLLPLCLFLVHLMPFGQPPLRMETQIGLIR